MLRGIERRRISEAEKDREDFLERLETVVAEMRFTPVECVSCGVRVRLFGIDVKMGL